jgi:hypothetical protein
MFWIFHPFFFTTVHVYKYYMSRCIVVNRKIWETFDQRNLELGHKNLEFAIFQLLIKKYNPISNRQNGDCFQHHKQESNPM